MNLSKWYMLLVHTLVALAAMSYGFAEDDLAALLVGLPLILAAGPLTGGAKPRPLPRWAVNLLLLGATVQMTLNWAEQLTETVTVLSRFVLWLLVIKLYERRTPRDQLQVILLSVMLVIGACLTSASLALGVLMAVYLPVLVATVMLYQVWSGEYEARARAALIVAGPPSRSDAPARGPRAWWSRLLRFVVGDVAGRDRRAAAERVVLPRRSRRDVLALAGMATLSIGVVSSVLFVLLPRGIGPRLLPNLNPKVQQRTEIGFNSQVELGGSGVLSESRDPVLELKLESGVSDPSLLGRPVRLRGAALDEYDPERGVWRRSQGVEDSDIATRFLSDRPDPPTTLASSRIVQHVKMLSGPTERLFTIWKPTFFRFPKQNDRIVYRWNPFDGEANMRGGVRVREYSVVSFPRAEALPGPLVWSPGPGSSISRRLWMEYLSGALPEPGPRPLPPDEFTSGPIRELTERVLRTARVEIDPTDRDSFRRVALAISQHLERSYVYTTALSTPDKGQDPIRMFLFDEVKGGRGHCEYFASALASMCLSVGVPARVVTGYLATEYDRARDVYIVRRNHAHAWVEAEVWPGRWEEFDPSPASVVQQLHQPEWWLTSAFRSVMDRAQSAWFEGVIGFDQDRQRRAIGSIRISPMSALRDLNDWVTRFLAGDKDGGAASERSVIIRFLGPVLLLVCAAAVGIYMLATRLPALLRRWFNDPASSASTLPPFEQDPARRTVAQLYRQTLERLAQAGHAKPAWLPLDRHRAALPAELAGPVGRISGAYYRARFAGEPVNDPLLDEVRAALQELADAVVALRAAGVNAAGAASSSGPHRSDP